MQGQEEQAVVTLQEQYYRDGVNLLWGILIGLGVVFIFLLVCLFLLYFEKPRPVVFPVGEENRIQREAPLNQPYLTESALLQWVATVIPKVFTYDFVNIESQLKNANPYFTDNGWKVFVNQLNIYAKYNNVQNSRVFINGSLGGAPYILNQGSLSGRYGWWVSVPLKLSFRKETRSEKILSLQILIVRVPTKNNLFGVGIENMIVQSSEDEVPTGEQ